MTLLGRAVPVGPRRLYAHTAAGAFGMSALDDLHLGVMLLVGGASYPAAGLWPAGRTLRSGKAST